MSRLISELCLFPFNVSFVAYKSEKLVSKTDCLYNNLKLIEYKNMFNAIIPKKHFDRK